MLTEFQRDGLPGRTETNGTLQVGYIGGRLGLQERSVQGRQIVFITLAVHDFNRNAQVLVVTGRPVVLLAGRGTIVRRAAPRAAFVRVRSIAAGAIARDAIARDSHREIFNDSAAVSAAAAAAAAGHGQ
jgi:hypothetical protein